MPMNLRHNSVTLKMEAAPSSEKSYMVSLSRRLNVNNILKEFKKKLKVLRILKLHNFRAYATERQKIKLRYIQESFKR